MSGTDSYTEIWVCDFEFNQEGQPGNPPNPVCFVAHELISDRMIKLWGREMEVPPFDLSRADVLTVGFYFSAESGCMMALGWPRPANVLDLYAEFRVLTNGKTLPMGRGLLGACAYFGVSVMDDHEKEAMRERILRGAPFDQNERQAILDYCAADVEATAHLFSKMLLHVKPNWNQAIARGLYTEVLGRVEYRGIPIDFQTYRLLLERWNDIKAQLIEAIDTEYQVFEDGSFRRERFERYLSEHGIPWPRLDSGNLALDQDTFKDQARSYPRLAPLRELLTTLNQMRLSKLEVGADGRSRTILSPFQSRTGRNQPSTTKFVFGPSTWIRFLMKPPQGMSIAYCDYAQQELGIAAALSGDEAMQRAYRAEDAYIAFAQMAGAVPAGATKLTHPVERERFKIVALAVQYGMTAHGLRNRYSMTYAEARQLILMHQRAFPRYWEWCDQVESYGTLTRQLRTSLGWQVQFPGWERPNLRSMRNWPLQSAGADMLRMAMIALEDAGIEVIAPVHDAVLIQAPSSEIASAVDVTQQIMQRVSQQLLGGFRLSVDAEIVNWPDRYIDQRGQRMWDELMSILESDANVRQPATP